jgi:hypothetical protein
LGRKLRIFAVGGAANGVGAGHCDFSPQADFRLLIGGAD